MANLDVGLLLAALAKARTPIQRPKAVASAKIALGTISNDPSATKADSNMLTMAIAMPTNDTVSAVDKA